MPIEYPPGQAWPPQDYQHYRATQLYNEYDAWYSGDEEKLWRFYSNQPAAASPYPVYRPSQFQPGLIGFLARFFWGRPLTPGQSTTHVHVPAPADLSALSRSLMWAEPPTLLVPDQDSRSTKADGLVVNANPAQDRLQKIFKDGGWYATIGEAFEIASAYGGAYVRAQANVGLTAQPTGDVITPDHAVPEWIGNVLSAVTFWRHCNVGADLSSSGPVQRHLERYEMVGQPSKAVCVVYHALYVGSADKLGRPAPLEEGDADCQRLAKLVGPNGEISIGTDRLVVSYLPNLRPHRVIKGTPLGRSDYSGLTTTFDQLDETWSALMRDVRLAKGRLIVPRQYLRALGPGRGATFDQEQEIFTGVDIDGPDKPLQITAQQFAIRVTEHLDTANGLWRTIVRGAGLSADAFGEDQSEGGPAMTATQATIKSNRTAATRGDKITYADLPLRDIANVILQLDAMYYGSGITVSPVQLEWPDAVAPDPLKIAQTLQMLEAAKAISTRQKVIMQHPDWSDADVDEEVKLIQDESAPAPVEDPGTFTGAPGEPGQPPAPGQPSPGRQQPDDAIEPPQGPGNGGD